MINKTFISGFWPLEPEDKRPDAASTQEKIAPIALTAQRIPSVWGAMSPEAGRKTKLCLYEKYILVA